MLRTIFFLAAYFASSIVLCQFLPDRFIPKNVTHPDWQCFNKGYRAACQIPEYRRRFICRKLTCADTRISTNPSIYTAKKVGPAMDGTFCGLSEINEPKICYHGRCRTIGSHHREKYLVNTGGRRCIMY